MKLPEPIQKPNGKWLIQVMVNGDRRSKTFDSKEAAIYWASGLKTQMQEYQRSPGNMTVGQAIDRYIGSKDGVLSPSTISGYRRMRKHIFPEIINVRLSDLTQEAVQRSVNEMAKTHSPKYVKNAHGLLGAALKQYYPRFRLETTFPQKIKYEIQIPTDEEIKKLLEEIKGTDLELPVLLAAWMGLRESEITGLTWDCIEGNTIHIKQAFVRGENGWQMKKRPKSYSGYRKIDMPDRIKELINKQPNNGGRIVRMVGSTIYRKFSTACAAAGLPHYRFHDLRHYNASTMLALGVPDKYAMERMGHATNHMLKNVYQHTMKQKEKEVADSVNNYFATKFATKK